MLVTDPEVLALTDIADKLATRQLQLVTGAQWRPRSAITREIEPDDLAG